MYLRSSVNYRVCSLDWLRQFKNRHLQMHNWTLWLAISIISSFINQSDLFIGKVYVQCTFCLRPLFVLHDSMYKFGQFTQSPAFTLPLSGHCFKMVNDHWPQTNVYAVCILKLACIFFHNHRRQQHISVIASDALKKSPLIKF